jgi:HupE / UreJ protein
MRRAALVILATLILWPVTVSSHEVPDDVRIRTFLKPEGDRMLILVRIPANALIDILFPTLQESDWLDLKQIDGFAAEGAKVWVADLLSLYEGDNALPEPQLLAVRMSRSNDASFNTFREALKHLNGSRLPSQTLLLLNNASVDALLETPIQSAYSDFSFQPNFARVGVRVTTTLAFLPADGGVRQFEYEGDSEAFHLNPSWRQAVVHFIEAGSAHYVQQTDYLLFLLCVALVFRRFRALVPFSMAFAAAQSFALIGSFGLAPSAPWIPLLCGVLIAASIVYMGIEAIVAGTADDKQWALAVGTGLIFGSGFWFGLQPVIQFGGVHRLASLLAFNAGIAMSEIFALALLVAAVQCLLRFSSAPRVAAIIAAAIAVRISWHRMLDRAHTLSLVPFSFPVMNPAAFTLAAMAASAALAALAYRLWRSYRFRVNGAATDGSWKLAGWQTGSGRTLPEEAIRPQGSSNVVRST